MNDAASAWELLHVLNFNFGPWDDEDCINDILDTLAAVDEDGSIMETVNAWEVQQFIAAYDGDTSRAPVEVT